MNRFALLSLAVLLSCGTFSCSNEESRANQMVGEFVSLKDRVDSFSDEEVMNIAYRNNLDQLLDENGHRIDASSYAIQPIKPLDDDLAKTIVYDFYLFIKDRTPYKEEGITQDRISLTKYCGTYEGYCAVRFYDGLLWPAVDTYETIGGYVFSCPYGSEVLLWREVQK